MTVINHKSISGITSITAPAGSDDLLTVHTNDTTERFRIVDSGAIVTGVTTASNFKTGTTNVHNVGVELAGINVLGADTPIGTGATIYNSGAAVFTGIVTAANLIVESKVGINSTSPTYALEVDGGTQNTVIAVRSSDARAAISFMDSTSGGYGRATIGGEGDSVYITSGNGNEKIRFGTGGTNGTIGINTTVNMVTNSEILSVRGYSSFKSTSKDYAAVYVGNEGNTNDSANALILFNQAAANRGGIGYVPNTGELRFNNQYMMTFCTGSTHLNGTERLRIKSDGNVAINSAGTATNLLDVRKDATSVKTHIGTINGQLGSMPNSSEYGISLVGGNAEFQLHKDGSGNYQLVLGTYQGSIDMPLVFRTDNRQERMRITKDGSVNIGGDYTSTTSRLRINTTSYPETTEYLAVFKAGVANGNRFKNRYIKIRNNYTGSVHGGVPIVWESNADGSNNKAYGAVVTEGDGDIRFLNAAPTSEKAIGTDLLSTISEKLRITSDGKVGINESNPGSQLVVRATTDDNPALTLYRHSTGGDIASLTWETNAGAQAKINYRGAAGANEGMQFYTAGGGSSQLRMIIDHSGNVGINRNDPAEMLDVYGTIQCSGAGLKIDTHPLVSYASFSDISGGTYAARLGSTGTSTIRSTQIYGGGGHIATFDGVNKRLGINVTAPDSALEIRSTAASYTPVIKLSNHHSGAWAGAIKFESNHNGTIWETAAIYGYGGMGSSDGILSIQTRGTERLRVNKNGQLIVTPSNDPGSAAPSPSISIVQDGNYNGTYPGISWKSLSTGGGNGMSLYCFDSNWDLYSRSGSQTGLAFLTDTSSSSGNARMTIGADGKVCLGTEVYANLSTSRDSYAALHIAGGGCSIGPKGNNSATRQGGRYILGWYMMSAYTGHSYVHVVTDLWGGGSSGGGNYEYIMGGFHIHGHAYSGTGQSEERIYFHNWNGNLHGHSRGQWGAWNPGNNVYVNSSGWVTLRLLAGSYRGYIIDLVQHAWYGPRNINVTAHTGSNSSTI